MLTKYNLSILIISLSFFGITSFASAVTYGSGAYNFDTYSLTTYVPPASSNGLLAELLQNKPNPVIAEQPSVITPLPTVQTYTFNKPIKAKSDIKKLQIVLNYSLKLNLKVDGILGKQTKSAIKSFQKNNNLTPDGIAGVKTRAVLNGVGVK